MPRDDRAKPEKTKPGKAIVIARAVQERDIEMAAENFGPLTMAEVDALSDEEVADRLGITLDGSWTEEEIRWMREGAKCCTDEYGDILAKSKPVPNDQLERYRQIGTQGRDRT